MAGLAFSEKEISTTRLSTRSEEPTPVSDVYRTSNSSSEETTKKESQALNSSERSLSEMPILMGDAVRSYGLSEVDHDPHNESPLQERESGISVMTITVSQTATQQDSTSPENGIISKDEVQVPIAAQVYSEVGDAPIADDCELFSSETEPLPYPDSPWEAEAVPRSSQEMETDPCFLLPPLPVPKDTLPSVGCSNRGFHHGEPTSEPTEDFKNFRGIAEQWSPNSSAESVLSDTTKSIPSSTAVQSCEKAVDSSKENNKEGCVGGQALTPSTPIQLEGLSLRLQLLFFYQLLMMVVAKRGRMPICWHLIYDMERSLENFVKYCIRALEEQYVEEPLLLNQIKSYFYFMVHKTLVVPKYLHSRPHPIVHQDVKASNTLAKILCDRLNPLTCVCQKKLEIVLSDFNAPLALRKDCIPKPDTLQLTAVIREKFWRSVRRKVHKQLLFCRVQSSYTIENSCFFLTLENPVNEYLELDEIKSNFCSAIGKILAASGCVSALTDHQNIVTADLVIIEMMLCDLSFPISCVCASRNGRCHH